MSRKTRAVFAIAFGIAGLLCAAAMIKLGHTGDLRMVGATKSELLAVSGPSAAGAGWLCAGLFGRPSGLGWFLAGNGALLTTFLGAAFGGTILAPGLGTLVAPLEVFWNFVVYPWVGLIWMLSMMGIHLFFLKSNK